MHGVSRQRGQSSEEQLAKTQAKIARYVQVTEALKARRTAEDYSETSLKIAGDVLSINSEYYTAWSFRRRILRALDGGDTPQPAVLDAPPTLYDNELRFCEQLLAHHPKSYWLWLHRTWLLQRLEQIHGVSLWEAELALCARFLDADRRNFHGWNHRRWVAERCGRSLLEELQYTTLKIEQDFSNYSAWQHRARLYQELQQQQQDQGALSEAVRLAGLDAEFELVRQAFFTEPDDQSPWFYYRWLLNQVPKDHIAVFERELAVVEELLEEEPDSKWALLTSIDLIQRLPHSEEPSQTTLITARFEKLVQVDPDRQNYYQYLQQKSKTE